ncbi:3'-5' exonuclease [Desulfonatronum thioautotrophicum]|uniref:3'-5' exonuclease n=1 Tax=Desulfonatronum thioautotrophicum TaxID=617001 RepID=UPI0005EAD6B5|nr:3'-5' exonuclease [Desulfonatronum thioautotrophicum]
MEFRIADTFTDSLARLSAQDQKAAKTTAFDLQLNPAHPGLKFHRVEYGKDPNFWSVRVSGDVRMIVHRSDGNLLLCYVDHHEEAYRWAEKRKLERHPATGAAQLVELREAVQEIFVPAQVPVDVPSGQAARQARPALASHTREELLGYGVPEQWLDDALQATEEGLLELAEHLPQEAAEALLDLAVGKTPQTPQAVPDDVDPFDHPDAQRRFRVMRDVEELARALDAPWEKWSVFLHPAQRQLVERDYNGPVRVSGSAGTGKTIVALHRAVHLARAHPEARVLLTTFAEPLANSLRSKLRVLIGNTPRLAERLEVESMLNIGKRLYQSLVQRPQLVAGEDINRRIDQAATSVQGLAFSLTFLRSEWADIVDAWQVQTWDDYRTAVRLGRKTRLTEKHRAQIWPVFHQVRQGLTADGLITEADLFSQLAAQLAQGGRSPFEFIIVDEAQDVSIPQLRFLAALGASQPNGLFFTGDLGQRIFQMPFSWKALGVDIRGRSHGLQINYRTSHQIRKQADRLLAPKLADVDGNVEDRQATHSVFNGPMPTMITADDEADEIQAVGNWLRKLATKGVPAQEIGVFVRSPSELNRARQAVQSADLAANILDEQVQTRPDHISIGTMHLAKGLEFRAVAVMACDDEIIPLQSRMESVADNNDLEDIYNTERHLLYVACTRAREFLLVSGVEPVSEFLDDMGERVISK